MDKDKRKFVSLERYMSGHYDCKHSVAIVDEEKAEIECKDCGEKLDPIKFLSDLAERESLNFQAVLRLMLEYQKAKDKIRRKFQHCDQMTRIDKSLPSAPKSEGFKPKVVK